MRVYDNNLMSDSAMSDRCRKFRDERTNVHTEEGKACHSIVNDEFVQNFEQTVCKKYCIIIFELSEDLSSL